MILINQLKCRLGSSNDFILKKIANSLRVLDEDIESFEIYRLSYDARKKPDIFMVLSVLVNVKHEDSVLRRIDNSDISKFNPVEYKFNVKGNVELKNNPVIVGAGPAGLFCAYFLAQNGYKPVVFERGLDVDSRTRDVEDFFNGLPLKPNSNVLFGEGGAGTFSDGKLNTLVKDKDGRNREVLKIFIKYGADPSILYDSKPHIGTDVLRTVIKAMREDIISMGGKFCFNAEMTDIFIEDGKVKGVLINGLTKIYCEALILAIGHSARNTFKMLYDKGISMEQKDFAVGLRVEHKQKMIDNTMYSDDEDILRMLPHASYKLTYKAANERGVYSFCMCPGGYVVNASSEPECLCVNGMSYSGRNGENANSAIVVTVNKSDFGSEHPLAGIEFQRKLERKAFEVGNGSIPVETYGDFKAEVNDTLNLDDIDLNNFFNVTPNTKGIYTYGKVSEILPKELSSTIIEGMEHFGKIIPGFNDNSTLLSGVESRTSSPVRIVRDYDLQSMSLKGLFPIGEGAGYAGGITSAAMDGIKGAEQIAKIYRPFN